MARHFTKSLTPTPRNHAAVIASMELAVGAVGRASSL